MTYLFYTPSGTPASLSRGRSAPQRDEFTSVAIGIQAAYDAAVVAGGGTLVGTSTTSVTVGLGSKAFVTQGGRAWVAGNRLGIFSAADPSIYMVGTITSYVGTTVTVNVTAIGNAGTAADWNIGLQPIVDSTIQIAQGGSGAPTAPGARNNFGITTGSGSAEVIAPAFLKNTTSARNSNTILAAADSNTAIKATTTFTQTFTAAATLGDGWHVFYRNDNLPTAAGIITLDPNGTELIDGQSTVNLYPGEGCLIVCDGAGFKTYGRSTGLVLVNRQVLASAQAAVLFALTADFTKFIIKFFNVLPATSGSNLIGRISQAGVIKSGANDYQMQGVVSDSGAGLIASSSSATGINLTSGIINTGTRCVVGEVEIFDPSNTTTIKEYFYRTRYTTTGSASIQYISGSADFLATTSGSPNAAQDGFQITMSAGNIAQGTFELYGIR